MPYRSYTLKNLVCYAHQIWCASIVQTGTPYRVCTAHHFLVCHAHLNWCVMHATWCAMHTTLVCHAHHTGVPCTPHWCAMHSIFGVHGTLVNCFIPPIPLYKHVIHNRIHKFCSYTVCPVYTPMTTVIKVINMYS